MSPRARHTLACLLGCLLPLIAGAARAAEADLPAMIGQMLLVGFRGTDIHDADPIARDLTAGRVGGVILFDRDVLLGSEQRNIVDQAQLRALTAKLQALAGSRPLFVAVDQEGGKVRRLKEKHGFPALPSATDMAAAGPDATRALGAQSGAAMARVGINLDFAPVLDLASNPDNPVIAKLGRSFGADPEQVARLGGAFAQGLHDAGVLTACKHFPGHGSSSVDSHLGLPDVTATWKPEELQPYQRLLDAGLCDMVMPGHLLQRGLDPDRPASLSAAIVQGLLREKLGFDGVVVSDDLQMKAIPSDTDLPGVVRTAVLAGVDLLLFGNNLAYDPNVASKVQDILLAEVAAGRIPEARIRQSYERIQKLKAKLRQGP